MKPALLLCMAVGLAGCNQEMADQPRYNPLASSSQFANDASARVPVSGTVDRGADLSPEPQAIPVPITLAYLKRGRERFNIFCSPCHGVAGDGHGVVPAHGFPTPPTFYQMRLLQASDRHYFDVITNGYGAMYPYASRVPPPDRWAITAYIRTLQYARNVPVAALPDELKAKLTKGTAP